MYANGEVPASLLVTRPTLEDGVSCVMMPGTAAKYDLLVRLAQQERGWTPLVSGPNDAYRILWAQKQYYRNMAPGVAAYPGTSSHGGTYDFGDGEVEQGAVDIGNWAMVGQDAFFDLARRAGFIPGVFNGHGTPDEPWHIFDPSPWNSTTQEDDMPLNDDDKNWVRDTIRQEIGGALTAYTPSIAAASGQEPLNASETDWLRAMTRQEIGGAMQAYVPMIVQQVAAALKDAAPKA